MDYTAWINEHLEQFEVKHAGHLTSVWRSTSTDRAKPLIVLLHGISGDFGGMVPLAVELSKNYQVAIIELPGHGGSGTTPLPSATALQQWFDVILEAVEKECGPAMVVCAHSFGCSAVLSAGTLARKKVILLNPVPAPSRMYVTYSRVIMKSAHFWAHIYNWAPFVLLRGRTLAKTHTREARRRVRWVGWHARPTFEQIVFQAGLADVVLDSVAYDSANNGRVALVVCGLFDTTARQRDSLDMAEVFGNSDITFLRGGHLLPIESPERVARLIENVMVK